MPKEELKKLIDKGEGKEIEFKESIALWKEIIETIAAFSNTTGGTILIGVSNRSKILGVKLGKRTLDDVANKIRQNTDPAVFPAIWVEEIDEKHIIAIEVKESVTKPVLAFGRAFKRIGKANHRLTSDEIRRLSLESRKVYWDEEVCEDAGIGDIDKELVIEFLKRAKYERSLDIEPNIEIEEALMRLKLLRGKKLINAGILVFGKAPQDIFLQAETRCARFKGTDTTSFIDMKIFKGSVWSQVDDAESFVLKHINLSAWVEPGKIERQERWEYPPEAIREAITNAVVHRDYLSSATVQVRIFDDRIEVWNPGLLPERLTIEDLKREHESIPRNRTLARLFFFIKYIEEWGTGTNRIINQCKAFGLPEPIFEERAGSFVVTIRKFPSFEGLNERQIKAISYIKKEGNITNKKYQEINNVSKRTASYELSELVERGILRRKGEGRRNLCYVLC
jgi:ATP-dependent DNA helicase RecG